MLFVYDLTCEHLRDTQGVSEWPRLAWRLADTNPNTKQETYRVVATSVDTGMTMWDSGEVRSCVTHARYEGTPLAVGGTYVWFVMVTTSRKEQACSSPSSFTRAQGIVNPRSPWGPQRVGIVWTSDAAYNSIVESCAVALTREDAAWPWVWDAGYVPTGADGTSEVERAWHRTLGIEFIREDGSELRILGQPPDEFVFAQGSLLTPCGLLVARWSKQKSGWDLTLDLAPGMHVSQ